MGLKLGADAVKKLLKALQKSDIGDQETFDPETYSEDIYNFILEDFSSVNGFGSEDASYFLEDILGEAENLMQEGIIDDVIESIASGEPDGWIQQVVERHIFEMEPGNKDTDEIINAMQETASDALTYYRDNWLGYHADDILEQGVNRFGDQVDMETGSLVSDKIKRMYDNNPPKDPPNELWYEDEYHLDPSSPVKPGGWEDPSDFSSALWDSYSDGLTSEGRRTLDSLIGSLDDIMRSGDMDDHIASIRSGNPTDQVRDWMHGFTDYDFEINDSIYTDSPMMDNDYAKNLERLLTRYRDNWLGYNADKYRPDLTESLIRSPLYEADNPGVVWKDNDWRLPGDSSQSLGVLKSDGVAPAAPQGPTGVLADPMGYPKIPGGMDAARQMPPQEQAFEELLRRYGLLHQF